MASRFEGNGIWANFVNEAASGGSGTTGTAGDSRKARGRTSDETARDLLKVREGDVAKGVPISPKIGRLRFEEAVKDLLNDYSINGKRSHDNLKTTVIEGALEPWFRARRMASLTTADIRAYVADRQENGYANGTINRELSALKRMFTLAIQAGKLLQRPHIPMLAEDNVRQGFFEREQFEAVRNRLAPMYQGVVTLAYYTGWRVNSEILHARVAPGRPRGRHHPAGTRHDEEPRGPDVHLCRRSMRSCAVIDVLWARHQTLEREGTITPLVFCRRRGQAVKTFWKRWKTASEAAGCPGRIPHDFRRTAVRNLNRAGIPETVAMKITGHKTRSVFDRYDITSEEDLAEATRKLRALTGTISGTNAIAGADALQDRTR